MSEEKRRHERVKLPYVIKYQSVGAGERWDIVNPVNMSESGICLLTMEEYAAGSPMSVRLTDPVKQAEYIFGCKVLRCSKSPARPMFYETVLAIEEISDAARAMYAKLLTEFGKK